MTKENATPDDSAASENDAPEKGVDPEDYDYVAPSDEEGYVDNGGGGL